MELDKQVRLQLLEVMIRIRHFEEKVRDLFADAELPGFVHLYIGEAAVAAGVCAALRPDDYITSTHRGHGHCIAKGLDLGRMMAELYGKSSGYCQGKGGSMHIADFESGMLGANGIVGAGAPIAAGAALSCVLLDQGKVSACFFGDGALAQGPWHEAVNLATVWNPSLPTKVQHHLPAFGSLLHGHVCNQQSQHSFAVFGLGAGRLPQTRKVLGQCQHLGLLFGSGNLGLSVLGFLVLLALLLQFLESLIPKAL